MSAGTIFQLTDRGDPIDIPLLGSPPPSTSGIGYFTLYDDDKCKKNIALLRPVLSGEFVGAIILLFVCRVFVHIYTHRDIDIFFILYLFIYHEHLFSSSFSLMNIIMIYCVQCNDVGWPFKVPSLGPDAVDETDCFANVACLDENFIGSPQCEAAGGGADMTMEDITVFITAPDENGCDVSSSFNGRDPAPICGCFASNAAPGCYFQLNTANDFTELVNAPGFGPDEEDDFCGSFKNAKQCEKKGGDGCLWGEDGCVVKGGLAISGLASSHEAVVGAGSLEQSNSGNGLYDMPLASAAMMLLSLFYALKW